MLRCFVAVDLATSEVVKRVSVLGNELSKLDAKMTFTKPTLIHVTLKFLGEIPELLVKRVAESLEEISFSPFSVELKGVGAFPNERRPRVIFVRVGQGASDLVSLAGEVERVITRLGFAKERRPFIPHATVARVKRLGPRFSLREFIEKYSSTVFGVVQVESFKLKQSVLTPQGPIYSDLRVYKLVP